MAKTKTTTTTENYAGKLTATTALNESAAAAEMLHEQIEHGTKLTTLCEIYQMISRVHGYITYLDNLLEEQNLEIQELYEDD